MKAVVFAFAVLMLLSASPVVAQDNCFGADRGATSTDWNGHYDWAQRHDAATLKSGLDSKLRLLFTCRSKTDGDLSDMYADMSVAVARDVPNVSCFKGDSGTVSLDRSRHRKWASEKKRVAVLEAADWKILAAIDCLEPRQQAAFYADISVVMAGGALRAGDRQFPDSHNEDTDAAQDSCFGPDRKAGSTNWDRHYDWAEHQDAAGLKSGLDYKMKLLFTCQSKTENQLDDTYADMSVLVAHYVRDAGCFKGDDGAVSLDRSRHWKWASSKSRTSMLEAMEAKSLTAVDCIDPSRQPRFYADLSVIIAGGNLEATRWDRDRDHDRDHDHDRDRDRDHDRDRDR